MEYPGQAVKSDRERWKNLQKPLDGQHRCTFMQVDVSTQIRYLEIDHAVDVTAASKGTPMSGTPEPKGKRGRPERRPIPKRDARPGCAGRTILPSIMAPEPSPRNEFDRRIAGPVQSSPFSGNGAAHSCMRNGE